MRRTSRTSSAPTSSTGCWRSTYDGRRHARAARGPRRRARRPRGRGDDGVHRRLPGSDHALRVGRGLGASRARPEDAQLHHADRPDCAQPPRGAGDARACRLAERPHAGRDQRGAAAGRRLLRRPGREPRLRDRAGGALRVRRAVILSAVRTPVGRYGGALADVRPDDLAAVSVRAAVDRAGVPEVEIEDVWLGCANQAGEDNRNVARMAVLLAGLPESVAGVTVNRLCASGLAAIVGACHAVIAGDGDLFVAGGVESMSRAPLVTAKPDKMFPRGDRTLYDTTLGWRFPNPALAEKFPLESMGETGENVAEQHGVSRADQDAFAQASQQRWAAAHEAGRFDDELV